MGIVTSPYEPHFGVEVCFDFLVIRAEGQVVVSPPDGNLASLAGSVQTRGVALDEVTGDIQPVVELEDGVRSVDTIGVTRD